MKIITYYQRMQWDGGDHHFAKEPAFLNEKDADEFLKQAKHDYFEKRTITLYDSLQDYLQISNGVLKQQALDKLSVEEKKALGLI